MMKKLKLGTQLNISFALVLFVPMIIATVFSIWYYSNKIRAEAVNTISSNLKTADIIYQQSVDEMKNIASSYAQKKTVIVLLGLNLGEKLGNDLAIDALQDNISMVTVVNNAHKVLIRSHSPKIIGDIISQKKYVTDALSGNIVSGAELLTNEELRQEGFDTQNILVSNRTKLLTITGAAPIYDRQREHIVAAMIVRRIVNDKSGIVNEVCRSLSVNAALFESTNVIASCTIKQQKQNLVTPSSDILERVLKEGKEIHIANITSDGSISKLMPIRNFNHDPIGILMVQTGVEEYIETRNIAIRTLLIIFLCGVLLAFSIKTIIHRRIVTPVKRLKTGAETIGSGDYMHTLDVTTSDEIGELTEAFNKMAWDLRQYDKQLKEYNQQLENRVKERTKELEIANEQLVQSNTILEETLETLNPGVSRLIGKNKQQLGLVYGTELVADICNYTKLNMILGETMMGEFMKRFFRESHKLIAQYRGLFDKTVGDQIVAIFGAPKDFTPASQIHPHDAIECALKMVEASREINELMQSAIQDNYTAIVARHKSLSSEDRENAKIDELRFQCRIGINTSNPASDREIDRMRLVMMGAETCVDYTAQGGAVIYAFRLESTGNHGEIHIGENTKRLVEHIYLLKEMPPIELKGLGMQHRYLVIGQQSIFGTIYPKTQFYQKYFDNIPLELLRYMDQIKMGRIQIKEVRKINEYLEVDISYLEHTSGYYNLSMARALFCYAVGEQLELDALQLKSLIFACLWHNAIILSAMTLEDLEMYFIGEQIPEDIEADYVKMIVSDLGSPSPEYIESRIINMCNKFDHMVFDRTCLKNRSGEIRSSKEIISIMKIEGKTEPALLDILGELMIADDDVGQGVDLFQHIVFPLPKDPEILASAIQKNLTDEKRNKLISLLTKQP